MTTVTIPADLAAEIRADLAAGGETAARWLFGPKWPDGVEYVTAEVDGTLVHLLVGSVDGGPRPAPGQRVLVLDDGETYVATTNGIGQGGHVWVTSPGRWCSRWALLPDPAEPVRVITDVRVVGASIDAHGMGHIEIVDESPEPEPESKTQPFNHRMCSTRHTVEQGCPLPPGALPASQLHRPPSPAEQDEMRAGIRAARAAERRDDLVESLICWLAAVDDPLDAPEPVRDHARTFVDALDASKAATGRLPYLSADDPDRHLARGPSPAERLDRARAAMVTAATERAAAEQALLAAHDRMRAALQRIAESPAIASSMNAAAVANSWRDAAREALAGDQ